MKEEWNKKKSICNNVENSIKGMEQYKAFDSLIHDTIIVYHYYICSIASVCYVAIYIATYSVKNLICFLSVMLFVLECTELLAQTIFFKCVFYYCFRLSNSDLLHVMYSIAAFCFVIFVLIQLYCKCVSDVPCSVHIYRGILYCGCTYICVVVSLM